jgi:phosphate transport system substrate-binding protein
VAGAQVVFLDADGDGQVGPDEAYDTKEQAVRAVAEGRYPSPPARDLNLVTQGKPTGLVRTFIAWVLTDGQNHVEEAGYISLPQDRLDEELLKLD